MQVQSINNKNNTLTSTIGVNKNQRARKDVSFGAIYSPKNITYNKVQEPIVEAITKAMREPLQKFKGKTAEGFYKSKGLDFEIAPHSSESVYLTAYKGMKEIGRGVDRGYTYSNKICIGEYDQYSEFRVSDIEAGIKDKNTIDLGFIAVALTGIAAFLAYGLLGSRISEQKTQEATKPLIDNVDSIANKAKAVKPILEDSFKLGKKVIRK